MKKFWHNLIGFINEKVTKEATFPIKKSPFPAKISKESINRLPLGKYEGKIVVINSEELVKPAVDELLKEDLLGFDTESRPSFTKGTYYPPSLIQFAGSKAVYLFQINLLENKLESLRPILENARIAKAGIAIDDDVRKLKTIQEFDDQSFMELSKYTLKAGIHNTGLRSLVAMFLGYRLSKGAQVSNWSKENLDESQRIYAATDAWFCRELYFKIQSLNLL